MKERVVVRAIVGVMMLAPVLVFAQADGSIPPEPKPADSTATGAAQAPAATTSAADPAPVPVTTPTATEPTQEAQGTAGGSGAGQPPAPAQAAIPAGSSAPAIPQGIRPATNAQQRDPSMEPERLYAQNPKRSLRSYTESGIGAYIWVILSGLALAIIPFGLIVVAFARKKEPVLTKEQETHNRCFDIETLMKDKLRELTDLKAMAKEKTVEMGKELVRDLVTGTKTGDLLVKIEKAEAEYNKLKKLFEECQIDIDRYKLKGVLIENSLLDKEILKQVRIIRSREDGDRVLHDIRLSEKQIQDIQKNIIDTKWFFHLWEPGKDSVRVVFKDALYDIKHSDKSTWAEAIKHGLVNGIPENQLDFKIE